MHNGAIDYAGEKVMPNVILFDYMVGRRLWKAAVVRARIANSGQRGYQRLDFSPLSKTLTSWSKYGPVW